MNLKLQLTNRLLDCPKNLHHNNTIADCHKSDAHMGIMPVYNVKLFVLN